MVISGCCSMVSQLQMIQLALTGLIAVAVMSIFTFSNGSIESYFLTSLAYQDWVLAFSSFFMGLFTAMSNGCSWSVQLGGTWTKLILCFWSSKWNSVVVWPRKQLNCNRAGRHSSNFRACLFSQMKGTIIFSMYRFMVSWLDQWLSLFQMSYPFGKDACGWHQTVFPL